MERRPLADRFWSKVSRGSADECWEWTGARIPSGYGSLGSVDVDGRRVSQVGAHRVSFYLHHGHWPKVTRHTCDNPPCVNPAHLLDGDTRLNAQDMVERGRAPALARTHCAKGHEFTPENTYISRQGHRRCRECAIANSARQAAKRLAQDPDRERALSAARSRAYQARRRAAEQVIDV